MVKFFTYLGKEKRTPSESGINDSYWLFHRSCARASNRNPYLLANEWICANLGWQIRLPIPPFALMRKNTSPRFFASLDFGVRETTPTDMVPHKLVSAMPRVATGVIVFDVFIANPDRHEGNLKVDNPHRPTALEVFDHDCALLGSNKKRHGVSRLKHVTGQLGLCKGITGGNFHKLASPLTSNCYMHEWISRIDFIHNSFIEDICSEARDLGISKEEAEATSFFLKERKQHISDIINSNKHFFDGATQWEIM